MNIAMLHKRVAELSDELAWLKDCRAENARLCDAVINAYALLTTVRRNWSKVDITDDLVVEAHRTLEAVLQRDKEGA